MVKGYGWDYGSGYIYIVFISDTEGPMVQHLSKFVGLHIIRYGNQVSDATLARQDRFVAVSISP